MNIWEKVQQVRVALQEKNIKKSGKNEFCRYGYFELPDFLPETQMLCLEYKMFPQVSFSQDLATLTITDIDKPEDKIIFTSPMSTAALKGCHEVQNLGAVETYLRRYLYMAALELTESDTLDGSLGKDNHEPAKPKPEPQKPAPPDNSSVAADAVTVKGAAAMNMVGGKHEGMLLGEIYKKHQDYAIWYMDKGFNKDIKTAFTTLHNAAQDALAKQAKEKAAKAAQQQPQQEQEGFKVQEEYKEGDPDSLLPF
jgi:hypothetical protein